MKKNTMTRTRGWFWTGTGLAWGLAALPGLATTPSPTLTPDTAFTSTPTPTAKPLGTSTPTPSPTDGAVWTQHNNNFRNGVFSGEKRLNPSTLNTLHTVAKFVVNDAIYAQPLYIPKDDSQPGRNKNLLFVATTDNRVCAFDAGAKGNVKPLWTADLLDLINRHLKDYGLPVSQTTTNGRDFKCEAYSGGLQSPEFFTGDLGAFDKNIGANGDIGILGTPVIDQQQGVLYVITRTNDDEGGTDPSRKKYYQWLWALGIYNDGKPMPWVNNPLLITLPARAGDHQDGFDPAWQNQRAALALSPDKKRVYAAWAGECDTNYYHGWVMGFDCGSKALSPAARFNVTPESDLQGEGGGIWQAGQGPVIDPAGYLYFATGNGDFNLYDNGRDYGNSIIKLDANLNLVDYFTPSNQSQLDIADYDLGSAGLVLIPRDPPGDNLILGAGKEAKYFLLRSSNLGRYDCRGNDGVYSQSITQDGEVKTTSVTVGGAYQTAFVTIGAIQNHYGTPGEKPQDGNGCVNTNHVHGGSVYWEPLLSDPKTGVSRRLRKVFVMPENDVARAYCLGEDYKFDLAEPVTYVRPVTMVVPRVLYSGTDHPAAIIPAFFGFNLAGEELPAREKRKKGEAVYQVAQPAEIGYDGSVKLKNKRMTIRKSVGMPGGMLSLSWDGDKAESGVLWVSYPDVDAYILGPGHIPKGILVAYQALDPADGTGAVKGSPTKFLKELWCSDNAPSDQVGAYAKYNPPTIADGRVYLATFSNYVIVYGNN